MLTVKLTRVFILWVVENLNPGGKYEYTHTANSQHYKNCVTDFEEDEGCIAEWKGV